MGSLGTGKQLSWRRPSWWSCFSEFDIDALVTQEFYDLSPMKAPLPVSPQQRMRARKGRRERSGLLGCVEWPEDSTDTTRFLGGRSITLALLTLWAGTAVTDAGGIDHTHTAITFRAAFLGIQGETSRTPYGAVRLGSEVFPGDASHPRDCPHR